VVAGLTAVSAVLAWELVTKDFQLAYVAQYSSRDLPLVLFAFRTLGRVSRVPSYSGHGYWGSPRLFFAFGRSVNQAP